MSDDAEELFLQASEILDADERAVFLEKACGNSTNLRASVEALLADEKRAESYFAGMDSKADNEKETLLSKAATLPDQASSTEGAGTQIGRYKLLEKLGEGGFGSVWAAEQKEPVRRRVALKIIKLGMDTQQVVARFEAERQALALMDHPNIAKVLDAGATDTGRPYFVMELVKGIAITRYCDQEKLSTKDRLDLFIKVCQAIQHAHQKGIIHRDIKPSNIMVTLHDGLPVPKVIDFGIAKATQQELTEKTIYTQYSQFIGTPAYMSPEQAEMSGLDIDTRSDIYSLGVLLYELLTGSTPFDSKELMKSGIDEMRRIIREREPLRPSTHLSQTLLAANVSRPKSNDPKTEEARAFSRRMLQELKGDLDWIVMKCLEKDRTRRYETANALAADIQRHLRNEPVTAMAPSVNYRVRKFIRRNTVVVGITASIAILLVIGISVTSRLAVVAQKAKEDAQLSAQAKEVAWRNEEKLRIQAEDLERQARSNKLRAEQERERAERALRQVQIQRAEQLIQAGDRPAGIAYLTAVLQNDPSNQVAADNLVSVLLNHSFAQPRIAPVHHADRVLGVCFSPDGGRWVTFASDSTVVIRDIKTGQPVVPPIQLEQPPSSVVFSSNGQWLLIGSEGHTAGVWGVETGRLISPIMRHQGIIKDVSFSPDDQRVATASADGTAMIWEWRIGRAITPPLRHAGGVRHCRFSPDGRLVATASEDGTAQMWDAKTGQRVGQVLRHKPDVKWVEFSPDGQLLATASYDDTAQIWEVPSGRRSGPALQHAGDVTMVEFAPHGQTVVTASWDHTAQIWDVSTGRPVGEPIRHVDVVIGARFSPDGQRILTASLDRTARIWDVASGQQLGEPFRHSDWLYDAAFSPDGQSVATASGDNTAILWEARISQTSQQHFPHVSPVNHAQFSPDGKWLVTAADDDIVRLWDVATGQPVRVLGRHNYDVYCVQFSLDGTRIVTASGDDTACVWDVASGQLVAGPFRHRDSVYFAEFSPDGNLVVTGGRDSVMRIWDIRNNRALIDPVNLGDKVLCARFSSDGRSILTSSGRRNARIWDLTSESFVGPTFEHQGEVNSAQFSSNGGIVVTGSRDTTAQLWDAGTGQPLSAPLTHNAPVTYVEFSTDSRRVVTATDDGLVRLWSTATGQPLTGFFRHGGAVNSARFSPDGRRLVTASSDQIVRVWDVPAAEVPVPAWFVEGANAIGGTRLISINTPEVVPLSELVEFRKRVTETTEPGFYGDLARWLFADRSTRTLSPLSTVTVTELIHQKIQENSLASLHDALLLSPTNSTALSRKAALLEGSNDSNNSGNTREAALLRALSAKWKKSPETITGQ